MSLKILLVNSGYPPNNIGGAEIYVESLAEALAEKHKVFIYTTNPPSKSSDGIKILGIKEPSSIRGLLISTTYKNPKIEENFRETLKEVDPDIVHFHNIWRFRTARLPIISKEEGYPTIMTLHDYWFMCPTSLLMFKRQIPCSGPNPHKCAECWNCTVLNLAPMKFSALKSILDYVNTPTEFSRRFEVLKETLRIIDGIIAPSKFLAKMAVSIGVPSIKIYYIPNGYPYSRFVGFKKKRSYYDDGRIVFGFVGVPTPQKGVHIATSALKYLKNANIELRIYGKIINKSYIKKLGNDPRVKIMGKFTDPKEPYSEIDVLLFPSLSYENCPLVLAEAALSRVPVIASDLGAIPEFVINGVNGFLFKPGDPKDLADKMKLIIKDPELIRKMGEAQMPPRDIPYHASEILRVYKKIMN
ncbi:hypothetical protein A3L04_02620 [Thermococcus chitonophagus]|uniref:Glycosyl transferase, group 1 n=1 Tax=Thermococcus chitonophagus TaxID=54262 RepID=A0A160VQY5_9EURY|nr:glycosyltransferase family 4 protein [Thermococcus chitonophagus]ASJ16049.1 hypothetical protein A3L04_02620 [Thermococcus chitonophagus]CUX77297.1 glycosyl transferase, group 1 [Thermococcus chitonophagus]